MPTFEEVDKHVKKLKALPKPTTQAAASDQLCEVYSAAKPILELLLSIPLVPAKWQAVGESLLTVLDLFCPAEPTPAPAPTPTPAPATN